MFLFRSKTGRVTSLVLAGVGLAAVFVGLALIGKPSRPSSAHSPGEFQTGLEDSRKVAGFVESFAPRIDETEKRLSRKDEELAELKAKLQKYDKVLAALVEELAVQRGADVPKAGGPDASGEAAVAPSRLQKFALAAEPPKGRGRSVRIPAGSFAQATLLTGVYAPTEGGVLPVKIRLDKAFIGPNRSRIPLEDAFLIGKATGDANSLRVVVQLDRLSYVASDGRVVEVPVNGYVADADGVQGLSGHYVWRIGEAATVAAMAGGISAAADGAAARETLLQVNPLGGATEMVTGDLGKFAAARGASKAADEIGKIVSKRLEEIVPAIYVANGQPITVCLIDGATLDGVSPSEVSHGTSPSPYAGLDLDR
jgi:hypothetical protein